MNGFRSPLNTASATAHRQGPTPTLWAPHPPQGLSQGALAPRLKPRLASRYAISSAGT